MAKKQGKQTQKRMVVTVRHVATADAEERISRCMRILLKAAARCASQSKDNINTQEKELPCETLDEDTLTAGDGECKDGKQRNLQD